jgi:hypothetical protein
MWPAEEVPNRATLYQRVHRNNLDEQGLPKPGAFRNSPTKQDGMSTDWDRYSTPQQTRQRARQPSENIVIALPVGRVREIAGQRVEHTPVQPEAEFAGNQAHCDVFGEKTTEARLKFLQIYRLVAEMTLDH